VSDKIQRYQLTVEYGTSLGGEAIPCPKAQAHGHGPLVRYSDHLAALEAQAEGHSEKLAFQRAKYEQLAVARIQQVDGIRVSHSRELGRLKAKHAAEIAALRGAGEPALITLTHEEVYALREDCEPVRIHRDFEPSFIRLCEIASECGVEIWPTHSIRYLDQDMLDLVVKKAKRSNHLAGSALDLNVVYEGVWYTNARMADVDGLPQAVERFLFGVQDDPDLRWGGTFGIGKDRVHFDNDLVRRDPAVWAKRVEQLRGER